MTCRWRQMQSDARRTRPRARCPRWPSIPRAAPPDRPPRARESRTPPAAGPRAPRASPAAPVRADPRPPHGSPGRALGPDPGRPRRTIGRPPGSSPCRFAGPRSGPDTGVRTDAAPPPETPLLLGRRGAGRPGDRAPGSGTSRPAPADSAPRWKARYAPLPAQAPGSAAPAWRRGREGSPATTTPRRRSTAPRSAGPGRGGCRRTPGGGGRSGARGWFGSPRHWSHGRQPYWISCPDWLVVIGPIPLLSGRRRAWSRRGSSREDEGFPAGYAPYGGTDRRP